MNRFHLNIVFRKKQAMEARSPQPVEKKMAPLAKKQTQNQLLTRRLHKPRKPNHKTTNRNTPSYEMPLMVSFVHFSYCGYHTNFSEIKGFL